MSLCPSESLALSCLPCATQRHPQGPRLGRGAPPPSDGLFVHGSPPLPSPLFPPPPVSTRIPLEWARQAQGSPPTPAGRTKAEIKDMTFSRPQRNGGSAILRPEVPRSECRLVASAPDPCPTAHMLAMPRSTPPTPGETGGAPAGRVAPDGQAASAAPLPPPEGGPSVGWKQVHGNGSAELPALQLATWRHVVLKMPGSWKA